MIAAFLQLVIIEPGASQGALSIHVDADRALRDVARLARMLPPGTRLGLYPWFSERETHDGPVMWWNFAVPNWFSITTEPPASLRVYR